MQSSLNRKQKKSLADGLTGAEQKGGAGDAGAGAAVRPTLRGDDLPAAGQGLRVDRGLLLGQLPAGRTAGLPGRHHLLLRQRRGGHASVDIPER